MELKLRELVVGLEALGISDQLEHLRKEKATVVMGGGVAHGVKIHADLEDLTADDHLRYHTDARGDARYYTQAQVDADIVTHTAIASAHHARYTTTEVEAVITAELVNGQSIDNAIDSLITTHAAVVAAHHARYTDAEVETVITAELVGGQSIDNAIDSLITTHTAVDDAHHAKYTDAEALIATILVDTRANILASSPSAGKLAYATDAICEGGKRFYLYDGTSWRKMDLVLQTDAAAPDMGYEKDTRKSGYHEDWITDKQLSNVLIGGNARTENGGIRVDVTQDPDTFEVYLRSVWNTIIYDLTTEDGDFRHVPLDEEVYIWRGDSVSLGLNGRPQIQEYNVSMGANPPAKLMYGGSF